MHCFCIPAATIYIVCRIVITISKHVVAQQTLAGGDKSIGVDESTDLGIVITGLEVVQLGFLGGVLAIEAKMADFQRLLERLFFT